MATKAKPATENTPPPVAPDVAPDPAPDVDPPADVAPLDPPAGDEPAELTLEQRVAALEATATGWQVGVAQTERTTGPGLTSPECPRCGADNNWLTVNLSDAVNVYRCRCGGRLEVHA